MNSFWAPPRYQARIRTPVPRKRIGAGCGGTRTSVSGGHRTLAESRSSEALLQHLVPSSLGGPTFPRAPTLLWFPAPPQQRPKGSSALLLKTSNAETGQGIPGTL